MNSDVTRLTSELHQANDAEYVRLIAHISNLWDEAKGKAAIAVNTELLEAN